MEKERTVRKATDKNKTRPMGFVCWITKVIDTNSEYVMLIAFPRQQWLSERVLMLLFYNYIVCLFMLKLTHSKATSQEHIRR